LSYSRYHGFVAAIAVLALTGAACGSSSKKSTTGSAPTSAASGDNSAAGNTASAPGITNDTYTVGFVSSETGVSSSNNKGVAAFKARIQAQNDAGGIFGRKIKVIDQDDASATASNLTAVQKVVQSASPFVMVDNSAFTFGSYRYLVDQKIPSITGGYDGPEYADPGNEYLLPLSGNTGKGFPTSTVGAQLMKDLGVSKGAGLGYGISPSSSTAATQFANVALPAVGLAKGYVNTSIPFGGENVGPIILDMKKQGVEGAYMAMDANTNFAIANTAVQNNLNPKVLEFATGYDENLLKNPTTVATAEKANVYISTAFIPYEVSPANPGTERMRDVLQKYAGLSRDDHPIFGYYESYGQAQLLIDGLKAAGRNPTRQQFVDAVRKFDNYTVDGLACTGVSFTPDTYGKIDTTKQSCTYYVKVENGKFVVAQKATGHLVLATP